MMNKFLQASYGHNASPASQTWISNLRLPSFARLEGSLAFPTFLIFPFESARLLEKASWG